MAYHTAFWNPNEDPPPIRYDPYEWDRNPKFLGKTYRQRLADEIVNELRLPLWETLLHLDPQRFPADREEFIDIYGAELQKYLN